ncbi:DUF5994 family protein [Labedaea rhizosphaerae]|uniref:DUF5994 family protein n=1 Tax=Labedaea rhizosphaerae TaxID=598644 RepID=UPI001414EAEA|nr:DUF5994 family protein [Labedaea rhizosphaerae]
MTNDSADPRLRWKPVAPVTGTVDGAWWPRSLDLVAELRVLSGQVATRLRYLARVAYADQVWEPAPRLMKADGHTVRLDGFALQDPALLYLSGPDRQRLTLLVIPPTAPARAADEAMTRAARPGVVPRGADILAAMGIEPGPPVARATDDPASDRRESDGGPAGSHAR